MDQDSIQFALLEGARCSDDVPRLRIGELLGAEIHLVKENEIVSPDASSHAKLVHGFKLLMARNYSHNLSEEARKGMREKAAEGLWPSYAPIGYINVEAAGRRIIVPDPDTAPLVRQMFEWYGAGSYSLREVALMAREVGLVSRRGGHTYPQRRSTGFFRTHLRRRLQAARRAPPREARAHRSRGAVRNRSGTARAP